ncbi:hypothetical protein D8B26_005231 [Coccidioides posadasii str. Silveira]|uniref:Uncharacterized protein n=1 Tax=Coccidioides posadasii (strain RMSCC 757 / Silveira) TaxID=443226 RepID=E9D4M0_COCPS|nr:conserved hypothetical protein [Coccidioides posadasii str. Silveira]QVM10573.1 hypothetical protein D8B26_005231 [Coccidioides posadasii str. Silveira]
MPWNEIHDTSAAAFSVPSVLDDPFFQSRDIPTRPHLRIAPLRNPIPPGSRKIPSPLEPATTGIRDSGASKPPNLPSGNPPTELPTLEDFLRAARRDNDLPHILGMLPSSEQPPKTILPAFISLRAVEKLPYSSFSDEAPRKRRRLEHVGDNFGELLQLPIPKVQKEIPKPRPFGPLPILNELKEPPPNAALFPPIEANRRPVILNPPGKGTSPSTEQPSSEQAGERRAQRIEDLIELNDQDGGANMESQASDNRSADTQDTDQAELASDTERVIDGYDKPAARKESKKPKRKLRRWSEQETHDLLRGVVRCGAGNWTSILAQRDLKFNQRTPGNLKDRFRVCCPWAYESGQTPTSDDIQARLADSISNAQSGLVAKIVLPDPRVAKGGLDFNKGSIGTSSLSVANSSRPTTELVRPCRFTAPDLQQKQSKLKQKRSSGLNGSQGLSNKSKSTLISLGLQNPDATVKSTRRHRRPFTPAEDEALLKGYAVHGFQWTLIRQDKHLDLMHRKATDLRDRFRTKFPDVYREGGFATVKKIESNIKGGKTAATDGTKSSLSSTNNAKFANHNSRKADIPTSTSGATAVPIDPAMSPPAPPSSLPEPPNVPVTPSFSFPIDEDVPEENSYAIRWAENTLPPLVWDELG